MIDLLESLPRERLGERSPGERSPTERRLLQRRGSDRVHARVFDDRPERARSGTEGWRMATPAIQIQSAETPTFKSPPYPGAWDDIGGKPRMAEGLFPSPPWAGGGVAPPSPEMVPEVRRSGPAWGRLGNFYGNYFGWGGDPNNPLNPASPVDLAAWYHDMEYGAIQEKYGANEDPWKAYWEPFSRFDQPEFIYDLAMSDLRFNENSWSFIGQGIDQGFYRGAGDLLAADVLMASVAWVFHTGLAAVRLAVYSQQVFFGGLYKVFTGEMSVGSYAVSLLEGGAKLLAAAGYFVAGTFRGLWSFGTASLRAIAHDPVRGLTGAAIGGVIGSIIGGPIGGVIGGLVGGAIGGGGGCFITQAACEIHGLADDHELLRELRSFRDGYMSRDPSSRALVEIYYRVSPEIVAELDRRPDRDQVYRMLMSRHIVRALQSIRRGRYRVALRQYESLLIRAATIAGLRHKIGRRPAIDRYRSLPDSNPATA